MLAQKHNTDRLFLSFLRLMMVAFLLVGCSTATEQPQQPTPTESPVDTPQAEISFTAQLPAELTQDQSLYLEILDEVTGLALNPARIKMEAVDNLKYTTKLVLPLHSVLKYRYVRDNDPLGSIEYTSRGQQVRYRLYHVGGPGEVYDIVSAWRTQPFQMTAGRINGQVSLEGSNSPVVGAMVAAGGINTFTASDGTFLLEGLPPGTHNLVVYSLDGNFQTFQQGAIVAPESTTPAQIQVAQTSMVNVNFVVHPPADHMQGIPIRVVGNTYSLGNTFADLRGGVSVLASRAPTMSLSPDGSYTLSLKLPSGYDLRYKYSLGDGFWNAELRANGSYRLRQLIVPNQDTTIDDTIETWSQNGDQPVSFTVTVPENTPVSDTISIQFNPYGWTEPIPMWPLGNRRWLYVLYSPQHLLEQASYRYCRNEQCGSADASDSAGANAQGKAFSAAAQAKKVEDAVQSWSWLDTSANPVIVSAQEVKVREANFVTGIAFSPAYHPGWQPYMGLAFRNLKEIGANTVILTPTWHYTQKTPPVIEAVPGQDPFWPDLTLMMNQASQQPLNIFLHPTIQFSGDAGTWWQESARDEGWWQSWFDRYRTFLLYHADLAAQMGAKGLIINDENLGPALPGGTLADGSASGVPSDAADRWQKLIADVRGRFSGQLIWMVPVTQAEMPVTPDFVSEFDEVYVRLSAPLGEIDHPTTADLEAAFDKLLDEQVLPLQEKTNQPVILGLQYASASGAARGCIQSGETCLPADALYQPALDAGSSDLDLGLQADLYSAALSALNQRSWISGFVSSGFYPPVELRDMSYSVRLKPAADILWYWFPRLTGSTSQ